MYRHVLNKQAIVLHPFSL